MKDQAVQMLEERLLANYSPEYYYQIIKEWFDEQFENLNCTITVNSGLVESMDEKTLQNQLRREMQQKISILLADKMFDYEINQKSSFGSITFTKSMWFLKGHGEFSKRQVCK